MKMIRAYSPFYLLLFFFCSFTSPYAEAESILVVGKSISPLSLEDLRTIYFQNGGRIADGKIIQPIDYKDESPLREEFYKRAFGKSKLEMKAYWAQRIFTGKGYPPAAAENSKELMEKVKQKEGNYIGYIKESELSGELSVLLRIQ